MTITIMLEHITITFHKPIFQVNFESVISGNIELSDPCLNLILYFLYLEIQYFEATLIHMLFLFATFLYIMDNDWRSVLPNLLAHQQRQFLHIFRNRPPYLNFVLFLLFLFLPSTDFFFSSLIEKKHYYQSSLFKGNGLNNFGFTRRFLCEK